MIREVNFVRDVIYGIAHLLGIDPEQDLLKDHARGWTASVNNHVRRGWRYWDWPELEVTEERAFRQVWYADVSYLAGRGDESEVYYVPAEKYYRATGDPDLGELPTDLNHWEVIPSDEMDYHIAYRQYGKQAIDRFISVSSTNPRLSFCSLKWTTAPSGSGIDLSRVSGPTVWVTYIPRCPEFTTETYSSTRNYVRGDLVLDLDTGDCYRALHANTNQPLSMPTFWLRQVMPYVISGYVKYAVAGEQSDDVQERATFKSEAEDAITREIDNLMVQGQRFFYGGPQRPVRRPLGITTAYERAYWDSFATG